MYIGVATNGVQTLLGELAFERPHFLRDGDYRRNGMSMGSLMGNV